MTGVILAEVWKENLRIRKDNFYKLCGELRPFIEREVTTWIWTLYSIPDPIDEAQRPENEIALA